MNMNMKMNTKSLCELVLSILLIIFAIMNYKLPSELTEITTTIVGKMVMLAVVVYLFRNCNPILAVLSVIACFKLMNHGITSKYSPSEPKKVKAMTSFNVLHKSLEEEMVSKMKPLGAKVTKTSVEPVLSETHGANAI